MAQSIRKNLPISATELRVKRHRSGGRRKYVGLLSKELAVAEYSFAKHGGTVGDIPLGVFLPNRAVITRAWFHVRTAFTSSGSATVALKAQTAGDLKAAAAIGTDFTVGVKEGVPTGTAATMIALTAERELTLTVATAALTAGKLNLFVEYVISD